MIKKIPRSCNSLQLIFSLLLIFLVLPLKHSWAESSSAHVQETSKLIQGVSKLRDRAKEVLKGKHHNDDTKKDAADIVEVIVSDTPPLTIPNEFKDAVARIGGKFIIVGDGKTLRILSLDGVYFNPCFYDSTGKVDMSIFNETEHTCKLSADLAETNMALAQKLGGGGGGGGGAGCGTCTANGAARWCKKSNDRYGCNGQNYSCETNC
ncbi:hypothetical protein MCAMS1_00744 [biofilm metagenome]